MEHPLPWGAPRDWSGVPPAAPCAWIRTNALILTADKSRVLSWLLEWRYLPLTREHASSGGSSDVPPKISHVTVWSLTSKQEIGRQEAVQLGADCLIPDRGRPSVGGGVRATSIASYQQQSVALSKGLRELEFWVPTQFGGAGARPARQGNFRLAESLPPSRSPVATAGSSADPQLPMLVGYCGRSEV